uniref:Ig-like domain-containing protein n=1 Tax=Panagrellus redivivus TaxID=6233 RepID=A0A7E4VXF3_PANRE
MRRDRPDFQLRFLPACACAKTTELGYVRDASQPFMLTTIASSFFDIFLYFPSERIQPSIVSVPIFLVVTIVIVGCFLLCIQMCSLDSPTYGKKAITVSLKNIDVNPAWTGATIMCQAAINGGTIDSAPVTVNVEYLKNVHVVDSNNQSPVRIPNQGNVFYVECIRGPDGQCQQTGRRKSLNCAVQANPQPSSYRWLKNGEITSGNGAEITIGTEMIGKSIQCSANNGLYPQDEMPTSQAVSIEPYSAARLIQTNFRSIQTTAPFTTGNRIEMNQALKLTCVVEGNPRPIVFWRMRRANGLVVDAPCPQGYDGQLHEITNTPGQASVGNNNLLRIHATCELHISDYSYTGQYWCSACSYVSYGNPECSPTLDAPGNEMLNMQVQGPPMQSEAGPSIEQIGQNTAVVTVHFCADPMPRPPREIVFSVEGNDIQLGQSWQNFRFDSTTQNNTVPNCYFARLQISPVHDGDKHKQIILKLQNQYGAKQIVVSLSDLLGDGGVHDSVATIIVGVVLGVICVGLIAVLVVICCMRRRLCCFTGDGFEGVKEYGNPSSSHNIKPTIGAPESYNGGAAAHNAFYADHGLESDYDAAYKAARVDSRISVV